MKNRKMEHMTKQNNKLDIIPVISLYELGNILTCKPVIDDKEGKKNVDEDCQIINNSFYFQLVNNNESLDIYYIFEDGVVLSDFFYHISITRNEKLNYLNLTLYDDNTNKKINNYEIGPFFKDNNGNIYNSSKKNTNLIKETISRLVNLQNRFW